MKDVNKKPDSGVESALKTLDDLWSLAQNCDDPMTRVSIYIMSKSICIESELFEHVGDYVGMIGLEKEKINRDIRKENRQRSKVGLEPRALLPVFTWPGANDKYPPQR